MKRLLPILLIVFSVGVGAETISHTFSDGSKYVGEVKGDRLHGQGTFTWPNGDKYVGEFKDGTIQGHGATTYANGDKYVGEFKETKYHGRGTLTLADGRKYIGQWKNDHKHGQGTMTWADGDKYVGEFKQSKFNGQGAFFHSNGDKYVGTYKNGVRFGLGTLTFASGDEYVGEWEDHNQHGQGTYTYANGLTYVGELKNGKKNGRGTETYPDGQKYVGEYKDDDAHGQGIGTFADGTKYVGEWRYGWSWHGTRYNASGEVTGRKADGLPAPACDSNPPSGMSTGFAVSQHHVVTNAHTLFCCKKVTVYGLGSCADGAVATIIATEQRSDLGLLRLDQVLNHYATLRDGEALQLSESVFTYDRRPAVNGCPQRSLAQGNVTKLNWMPDDSRLMLHDARTGKGSSGGPVSDASGHIVGVTQGGGGVMESVSTRQRSYAVKSPLLQAFLKSNNVEYRTALSDKKLGLSDIKKKADSFTVIVKCLR